MKKNKIWRPFTQHKISSEPIIAKKAKGSYIFDENNKKYIDLISSWWTNIHGHCNKNLSKIIAKQSKTLDHVIFADFIHNPAIELIENLDTITNNNFDKYFFSDNGSTSVEVAIKMMIQYHKNLNKDKKFIIAFEGGYHGDTFGSMSIGKKSNFFKPFEDMLFEVLFIPFPATWKNDSNIEEKEKNTIITLKQILLKYKNQIAGAIFEPLIQGASGMNICRIEFMNDLMNILRNNDIIVAFDEVMTGFLRTGKFFAYQHLKHSPDIICLSKGITGGMLPFGVTACKEKIFKAFFDQNSEKAFLHGHSYTGNPIICAIANENIKLMINNNIINKVEKIIKLYDEIINKMLLKEKKIQNIRAFGSILAFDIISDNKNYGSDFSIKLKEKFLNEGLILRPLGNTIYINPPFSISKKDIIYSINTILKIVNLF